MEAVRGCDFTSPYVACYQCDKIAEEPRLCPRCGQSFCNSCLLRIVTSLREQCPACCVRIREQDFLQPQAVILLAGTIAEKVRREGRRGDQREQCAVHQLPLAYFCTECNHPLCADCALLTTNHTGHRFVSYRDIYERIKKRVYDEFPKLDRKSQQIVYLKEHFLRKGEGLYEEYRRYKKVFEEAYITYTERVEAAAKAKEEVIASRLQSSQHRLAELQHLRDNIYEEMEKKTQLTLIKQSGTLIESINALTSQEPPQLHPHRPEDHSELEELIPDYTTWNYKLEGLSTRTGIVYSEGQIINGVEWRLKVYPKGNGLAREKYLSVFVEMSKALGVQNKYEYRIELVNPSEPNLTVKREYCSTFQIGECWGYNQFQPLEQLPLKEFIQNDALIFRIGIRNRSYRSLVYDQGLYVELLKVQIREKEREEEEGRGRKIKSLRERDRPLKTGKEVREVRSGEKEKLQRVRDEEEGMERVAKVSKEENGEQLPFQQSYAYGLIQEFLKKQQIK